MKKILCSLLIIVVLFVNFFSIESYAQTNVTKPCLALNNTNWTGTWQYYQDQQPHSFPVKASALYDSDSQHLILKITGTGVTVSLIGSCYNGKMSVSGAPQVTLSGYIIGKNISLSGMFHLSEPLSVTLAQV